MGIWKNSNKCLPVAKMRSKSTTSEKYNHHDRIENTSDTENDGNCDLKCNIDNWQHVFIVFSLSRPEKFIKYLLEFMNL